MARGKAYIRGRGLSRFWTLGWVAIGLGAAVLAGCASGKQTEVTRLQAQSAFERGVAEFNDGRLAMAISSLQEAVQLDPSVAQYSNALGVVYLGLGRSPEALEEFKRAVDLNPRWGEARHNLGVAYATVGKWREAIQQYREALAVPGYSDLENTYHNLGWAHYNLDRLQEAEESFRMVLRLSPKFVSAYYHLGLVLVKAGRRDEARAAFRQARELGPDTPLGLSAKEHLKALGEGG